MSKLERLDKENEARLNELNKKAGEQEICENDIFLNKSVLKSIQSPKVIIPSFEVEKILLNYPFSSEIYVTMCPHCECVSNSNALHVLLDHNAITPILYAPYSQYPENFIDLILNFPHISCQEFLFYRNYKLLCDAESRVCDHCIENKYKDINALLDNRGYKPIVKEIVKIIFTNLSPYIYPDSEIIKEFESALKKDDSELADQLFNLSWVIRDARTIKVYKARSNIPSSAMHGLLKETGRSIERISDSDLLELYKAMSRVVEITIPKELSIKQYLEIIGPYRKELNSIVESILEETKSDHGISISKISARIGEINEQLFSLQKKKRFLTYRATVSFLKANKALIATSLLAGMMGLTGNFIGCGVSVAGGIGAQIIKRKSKIKLPKEFKELSEEIANSVRPYVNRMIAKSLYLDINAVQLWDIKEKLSSTIKK